MEIALSLAESSGRPYVTVTAEQNAVANRRMVMFAEKTRCLYDDAIPFTLNPGGTIPADGVYSLRSAGAGNPFTKRICLPEVVYIDGTPLLDFQNNLGLVGIQEIRDRYRGYLITPANRTSKAFMIGPDKVRLYPVPDQAYTNCFVSGFTLPDDIDTSGSGDNTEIAFNEEDAECVAVYVGLGLIEWTQTSESDYERMAVFSRPAAERMQALMNKNAMKQAGPAIRGKREGITYLG